MEMIPNNFPFFLFLPFLFIDPDYRVIQKCQIRKGNIQVQEREKGVHMMH